MTSGRYYTLLLVLPVVTFSLFFFVVPISFIARISFYKTAINLPYIPGFTLESYVRFLSDSYYLGILFNTLKLGFLVTVLSLVAGYLPAYVIGREENPARRNLYLVLIMISMWTNMLVRLYGWVVILGKKGLINNALIYTGILTEPLKLLYNFPSVAIVQCFAVSLPYVILTLSSVIQGIDRSLFEVSIGLHASRFRTFFEVSLPLSLPGVIASSTIAFVWAIEAYAVPSFLGSPFEKTMSMEAYFQMIESQNWPFSCVISVIIFVITAVVTLVAQKGALVKHTR
jgi:putative spermidine/putrescine transport system permease protein